MTYDAVVIGLGAHGSAAAAELARRGNRVLGIEAFAPAHALGSSGGLTRIIRLAYMEHPSYVPLLQAAWSSWRDLEREYERELLVACGGLYLGARDSHVVSGAARSAREHGLAHELLEATEIRRRFPAFAVDDSTTALFETQAGFLRSTECIQAFHARATRHGAELRFDERVTSWAIDGSGVSVSTASGTYRGERLIVAAGAWTMQLLPGLPFALSVERVPLFWYSPSSTRDLEPERFPVYIMETDFDGDFYGFPYLPEQGFKAARHHSGALIASPDALDRSEHDTDAERVRAFLKRHIPGGDGRLRSSRVCMYTNTPDLDFVIDRYQDDDRVVFASACSGHGFKFSTVIGEILADLATQGRSRHPVDFLSLTRFTSTTLRASSSVGGSSLT